MQSTGPITLKSTNGTYTTVNNFSLPATITSFSPTNSAPGTVVTILGNNFSNTTVREIPRRERGFHRVEQRRHQRHRARPGHDRPDRRDDARRGCDQCG